jgi:hypothetical protein
MGEHTILNNALFSSTGERRLPNNDLLFNGNFEINGGATLDVINEYDREIEIKGDLIRTTGAFDAGTGATASVLLSSGFNQNITGDFTSTNSLNILEVDNSNGVTLSGDVNIERQLILTDGAITTGTNALTIALSATVSPASGTSSQYINGELAKVMTSSQDFVYPIGDNGNLGVIELVDVSGFSGTGTWSADYEFTNPTADGYDATSYASPINYVSQTEYWSIQGPAGGQSDLTITLDGSSDVANAISDLADLRFVGWDGAQWVEVGGTPTVTGTAASGTISTGSAIDFDTYQYITLGSVQAITVGTASIVSTDVSICNGESTDIIISLTGATPWSITYTDGTTPVTIPGIASSPYTLNVSPTNTTTYTLTAVSDNNGPGTLVGDVDVIVTVNSLPVPTITGNATACQGVTGNVYSTESGMGDYTWVVSAGGTITAGGTALDDYVTITWTGTGAQSVSVNYTNLDGCTASSPTTFNVTVTESPVANLTVNAALDSICTGNNTEISISFTAGTAPYNFTISDGTTTEALSNISANPYTYIPATAPVWVDDGSPDTDYFYTITTITDDNGCSNTNQGNEQVTVFKVPDTGPQYHIENTWSQ